MSASSRSPARAPEAVLRRLEWTVIRRLDGVLHGDYRTLFRGYGLDLADLREYVYNDDVRHIDWNVTARLQTPYVREYHEEREVAAWFLLDLSPSVAFGSQTLEKRTVASEFVAVLARILTSHGNRVGALLYSDRVDTVIPARGGRRQVLHLLHRMEARPDMQRSAATNLADLIQDMTSSQGSGSQGSMTQGGITAQGTATVNLHPDPLMSYRAGHRAESTRCRTGRESCRWFGPGRLRAGEGRAEKGHPGPPARVSAS